ncbi:MAG: hypothetical protein ACT4OT_18355 [Acidobacteriota bacterium]
MNKDELMELAGKPNFISGIHNYCDRWCERCQFTSRCAMYAIEQADPDIEDSRARDITNEEFWRKMHEIFRTTAELIAEWSAKHGVDLNAVDSEDAIAEHERDFEEAEQDALSQAAHAYSDLAEQWLRSEFVAAELIHDESTGTSQCLTDDITIAEAVDVIRWYQFFIAAKTFRAVDGSKMFAGVPVEDEALSFDYEFSDDDDEDVDYDAVLERTAKMDSHGSAKVALAAIGRSSAAWRSLQISLPEKSDTIQPLLVTLDRLRRGLEARFPRAHEFIRPGFDELITEFVS